MTTHPGMEFSDGTLTADAARSVAARPRPNLFIIGAPKCATSTVFEVLRADPQCYLPAALKEPMFLAGELYERRPPATPATLDDYLELFAPAAEMEHPPKVVGEASTTYLYSPQATRNALALNPGARFIAILRHPLDFIESYHRQLVATGIEEETNLAEALRLEDHRRRATLPKQVRSRLLETQYSRLAEFGSWISAQQETLPEDRFLILFLEDLKSDPHAFYSTIYDFLGLDPPDEFPRVHISPDQPIRNAVAVERFKGSAAGRKLMMWRQAMKQRGDSSPAVARLERMAGGLYDRIFKKEFIARGRLAGDAARGLHDRLRNDLALLESCCRRDLPHWRERLQQPESAT